MLTFLSRSFHACELFDFNRDSIILTMEEYTLDKIDTHQTKGSQKFMPDLQFCHLNFGKLPMILILISLKSVHVPELSPHGIQSFQMQHLV